MWSLLGSLAKFKKEAHSTAESDHMKNLLKRIEPAELEDVLDGKCLNFFHWVWNF